MVKIATNQTDPDKKGGGTWIDAEGLYHFCIDGARDLSGESVEPRIEFDLTVLASDAQGQDGKKTTEKFYLVGKNDDGTAACLNRLMRFFCAIGLYNEEQWKADREANVDQDFNVDDAVGRQFCTKITLRKGTKPRQDGTFAMFYNIGFDLWSVGDEEADACPKSKDWIEVVTDGGKLPTRKGDWRVPGTGKPKAAANGNDNGNAKPTPASTQPARTPPKASTPPRAATPPAPAADEDDIPF